ncbi:MAG: ribosome biogenesis factor YjgA [Cellvibrionaceae bacterium]
MNDDRQHIDDEEVLISKSQLKREMEDLQKLGKQLIDLNETQRKTFSLPEELEDAILEHKRITKNEAKRRQMQFIGKLMRKANHEAIQEKLDAIVADQSKLKKSHHMIEEWRDKLITGDQDQVTQFLADFPNIDRQTFRQLTRNAIKERKINEELERKSQTNRKKSAATRKLFQFIRDNILAGI